MIPTMTPKITISEKEVNSMKFPLICTSCNRGFLNETSLKIHSNHTTLCTKNPLIQRLRGATKAVQLAAKRKKEKIMIQAAPNIIINGITIGTVTSFKYLGHLLTADNDMYAPIQDRYNKARNPLKNLFKMLHSKDLSLKLKQRLLKCTVTQVFLHGSCTWELSLKANIRLMNSPSRKLKRHCNENYLTDAGPLESLDINLLSMARTRQNKHSSQLRTKDPKKSDGSPALKLLHNIDLRRKVVAASNILRKRKHHRIYHTLKSVHRPKKMRPIDYLTLEPFDIQLLHSKFRPTLPHNIQRAPSDRTKTSLKRKAASNIVEHPTLSPNRQKRRKPDSTIILDPFNIFHPSLRPTVTLNRPITT